MDDERYPAGTDVPGTPSPFPFGLIAASSGFGALATGLVALLAVPMVTYAYWFLSAEWLVLSFVAISRDRAGLAWLGAIGVLAPLAASAIMGSMVLIRIPG